MAIRIPTISNEVQPETAKIPNPADYSVAPPKLAFGEFQSTQDIGNTISNIGVDLNRYQQRKQEDESNLRISQISTQHSVGINDLLRSNEDIEVELDGEKQIVKKGLLYRPDKYANDVVIEGTDAYHKFSNELFAQAKTEKERQALAEKFGSEFPSFQQKLLEKAVEGDRRYKNSEFDAGIKLAIDQSNSATNIDDLVDLMNKARNDSDSKSKYNNLTPELADLNRKEILGKIVSNSSLAILNETGDINAARDILNQTKDIIDEKTYRKINTGLGVEMERIRKQQKIVETQAQINNQADYINQFLSGNMSWMDIQDIAKDVRSGKVSDKFGLAMSDVIKEGYNYTPKDDENENYPDFIDSVLNANDQVELHDTIVSILSNSKNISRDKLAIIINQAMKRSNTLPLSMKISKDVPVDEVQLQIDTGSRAIVRYGRNINLPNKDIADIYGEYQKQISLGKEPKNAYNSAIYLNALKYNPNLADIPEEGKVQIDKNGNIFKIFPTGKIEVMNKKADSK